MDPVYGSEAKPPCWAGAKYQTEARVRSAKSFRWKLGTFDLHAIYDTLHLPPPDGPYTIIHGCVPLQKAAGFQTSTNHLRAPFGSECHQVPEVV